MLRYIRELRGPQATLSLFLHMVPLSGYIKVTIEICNEIPCNFFLGKYRGEEIRQFFYRKNNDGDHHQLHVFLHSSKKLLSFNSQNVFCWPTIKGHFFVYKVRIYIEFL